MNIKDETKELIIVALIVLLATIIFSYVLFGITGIRVVIGIALMSLPFYILLNRFEFTEGEIFIFSLLLGLTIFPSLVYLLGLVISFRIAILITFTLLSWIAFLVIKKYKSKEI